MIRNAKIAGVSVDPTQYHGPSPQRGSADYRVSSSSLRLFYDCPAKWVRPIKNFDGSTSYYNLPASAAMADGNLFDTMLLTPEHFDRRYVLQPESYTDDVLECPSCGSQTDSKSCRKCGCDRRKVTTVKAWDNRSAKCRQWLEENGKDKELVTQREIFEINQAIEVFKQREQFRIILEESEKQVHIAGEWHDPDTGVIVPIQCLIDLVPKIGSLFEKSLADVKRTKCARPMAWERWAHQVGYEVQAAWNTDLFSAACPDREIVSFRFLLSESHPPFETGHRYMEQDLLDPNQDAGDIASGRRQYRRMMAAYCRCIATGQWPGYDDHDEAVNGATRLAPNPYAEQARQFAPKFEFAESEPDEVPEDVCDIVP